MFARRPMRRRAVFGLWLFAVGAASSAPGCFAPHEAPCAFSCVTVGARCPENFTCGGDGLCHRDGAEGVCLLTPPDAGAETSAADANTND